MIACLKPSPRVSGPCPFASSTRSRGMSQAARCRKVPPGASGSCTAERSCASRPASLASAMAARRCRRQTSTASGSRRLGSKAGLVSCNAMPPSSKRIHHRQPQRLRLPAVLPRPRFGTGVGCAEWLHSGTSRYELPCAAIAVMNAGIRHRGAARTGGPAVGRAWQSAPFGAWLLYHLLAIMIAAD